ncbi:chemotaxis protein CheA [Hephaestia sp. GCM10023244]|uniref:chemotaxis protein CheA n=1 Tax=unclassified Hephaestia TaxID=2631281 RepID=UPI00207780D7|nr:chemotaxis protein CheW [Hephaestia sp. MAHUQ-44]MCM8730101.1 chemotaxis protein CheW [Hephaestia sp. MAHUQ-44]
MDDLLQEFIAETRETLEALSGEIVAWEADPANRDRLDAIFRFVHTVKGSCGFLDLPRLARLSHAAEDVLAAVRSGARVPDRALVNAVLAIVDRIGEIVEAIDSGQALGDSGEDLLIAALDGSIEATPAGADGAPHQTIRRAATRSVRLSVDLLDRMMSGMSDMVLARNELARRLREDVDPDPLVEASLERLSLTVAEMRETVTRTRMQKIDALFSALPRMVRDTAAGLGKSVSLSIEGGDVELDREMIEMIRDPLGHIVRNALDHGIETPAERRAAGKRETGRLTVSARQSGNQIIIEFLDDGRGIDTDQLVRRLVENGVRSERELRELTERQRLDLVFEPGLTTKEQVTAISGRGVGMDVVRANIEQIGGRIELANNPGRGLRIAIHVPLTLSIIPTIVVGVGTQRFAVPRQAIEEIVTVRVGGAVRIDRVGGAAIATVRDRRLPMLALGDLLGLGGADDADPETLMIVGVSGGSYAIAVDSLLDNEELVIKPAPPAIMASGVYAGLTLPDSGTPMLLLDCAGLADAAGFVFTRDLAANDDVEDAEPAGETMQPALLFVDLDGVRRAVPLAAIDRVEPIATDAIQHKGGRLRLSIDGGMIPLAAQGAFEGRGEIHVIRMKDGEHEIGYAIAEALDITDLPLDMAIAREPGPIAGVIAFDDDQIEMLDIHWLFADQIDGDGVSDAPLCLIAGREAAWMATFLRPVLERAGYRVTATLKPGETAAVVLAMDDDAIGDHAAAPLVRLSRTRDGADARSIYRYDRTALLGALASHRLEARA